MKSFSKAGIAGTNAERVLLQEHDSDVNCYKKLRRSAG